MKTLVAIVLASWIGSLPPVPPFTDLEPQWWALIWKPLYNANGIVDQWLVGDQILRRL